MIVMKAAVRLNTPNFLLHFKLKILNGIKWFTVSYYAIFGQTN